MSGKIRIKVGEVEVEYEGSEDFIKKELSIILKDVSSLYAAFGRKAGGGIIPGKEKIVGDAGLSATTIAQRLKVTSGPELIMAAALHLTLSGTENFTKKNIREKMRGATGYYKSSYAKNFDAYLTRLVKTGRISHSGGDSYSVPVTERENLVSALGVEGA